MFDTSLIELSLQADTWVRKGVQREIAVEKVLPPPILEYFDYYNEILCLNREALLDYFSSPGEHATWPEPDEFILPDERLCRDTRFLLVQFLMECPQFPTIYRVKIQKSELYILSIRYHTADPT